MRSKKVVFCAFIGAVVFAMSSQLRAETLVVDKVKGPYKTIQEAVDAANEGDTVLIKKGVYDQGGKEDAFATKMMNRVYISKSLTLKGESKESTIIKGALATEGVDNKGLGLGANAVRCLAINADNVQILNLTLTSGATHNNPGGGGVC